MLGAKLAPNSSKIWSKIDTACDHFFDWFLNWFLEQFGANLGPTWLPKPSQNGAKLASKSHPRSNQQKTQKHWKNTWFFNVFGGFEGLKLDPKSIKNRFNKVFKTTSKFEWVLDGSWVDFRSILEAKLRPSWLQNRSQRASKPISKHGQKIDRKSGLRGHASRREKSGCWPLRNYSIHGPGNPTRP